MASLREISGNTFGNDAIIVQGDLNTTDAGSFLNEISKTDPYYDKKRILELKGPLLHTSFDWILDHKDFQKWRHTKESGVLWIKGDPGKGKTMLLCGIIEDLETDPGINSNLGYFFCQATDSRINTAASIIAGLIFSLIKRRPALLSTIRGKYQDKMNQLEGPNAWVLLCDIFKDTAVSDPVCIVDALDECEHDCKLFLSLVVDTSTHVKWLLSSRNVKDIERRLRSIEPTRWLSLELKENAENISKSVDAYITNSIRDIETLGEDEELRIRTTTILRKKANGTFLWVALVIEQLRDTDRRNVEDVLEEMPEGLESLYDQILKRANSKLKQKDQDACRILLSTITTAERPLHLEELQVFISSQWDQYKATYKIQDIKDIIKDIGSLLSIRDDTVYFIHQSVKDYLVGTAAKNIFPSGIEYQHYQMAKISLEAMSILKPDIYNLQDPSRLIDDITTPEADPLRSIAYCCVFWVEHLDRGCRSEGLIAFKDDGILHAFLKVKFVCWLESLVILRSLTPQGADAMHKLKKLVASHCGNKANGYQLNEMTNPQVNGERNCLRTFINDAYQFFHSCKDDAKHQPLSLYYSAIVFEDENSAIYRTFRQHTCTFQQPRCRQPHLGDLTFVKKPPRRLHLQHIIDVDADVVKQFYSPNSSTLCVLSTKRIDYGRKTINIISLYRTDTGILLHSFRMNADIRSCNASFSADSRHLILVSPTGVVQKLATDSGLQLLQIFLNLGASKSPHVDTVLPLEQVIALSPYGDLVASACYVNYYEVSSIKIWTTQAGACECEIDLMPTSSHEYSGLYAIFAPNSALIALVHWGGVRIYSARTGKEMKYIHWQRYLIHQECSKQSKFSQDSALLALARTNTDCKFAHEIFLWCTKTWKKISHITQLRGISSFDFSPDGATFALTTTEHLTIGSCETGQQLLNIATGHHMDNVSLSPDWPNISLLALSKGREVHIWRADTKDTSDEMHSTAYSDRRMTISPGSKYVGASDLDGGIRIWSAESGKCVRMLKRDDSGQVHPTFSPNWEFVACTDNKGADVWIWHVKTGKFLHLLKNENRMSGKMIFSDDSKYLITGYSSNGVVRAWCVKSGKRLFTSDESNWDQIYAEPTWPNYSDSSILSALAVSTKSKYVASAFQLTYRISLYGGRSRTYDTDEVRIWNWHACKGIFRFRRDESVTKSLTFSSDATVLVTISHRSPSFDKYMVHIWEVATGICIGSVEVKASYGPPIFDPITNKILADSVAFCKGSSWDHWDKVLRPGCSIMWDTQNLGYTNRAWICLEGEKVWLIPKEISPEKIGYHNKVATSTSLLAYTTSSDSIIIIRFPGQHDSQILGGEVVDFDEVSDAV